MAVSINPDDNQVPFTEVGQKEAEEIELSRHRRLAWQVIQEITSQHDADSVAGRLAERLQHTNLEPHKEPEQALAEAFDADEKLFNECAKEMNWLQQDSVGLALSGGGIRSATFNLGVLQALAKLGGLPRIDYLSTVSGGGYIGSWLAAWLKRSSLGEVMRGLHPDWGKHASNRASPEIEFLRDYSNYLTPRVGLLTADTWTAVAIFTRNLLLNLMIVVSATIGLLLLPYWLACMSDFLHSSGAIIGGLALLTIALLLFFVRFLPVALDAETPPTSGHGTIVALCACWLLGVYLAVCWAGGNPTTLAWTRPGILWPTAIPVGAWLVVGIVLWIVRYGESGGLSPSAVKVWLVFSLLSYAVLSFGGCAWVLGELAGKWQGNPYALLTWGVPLVMLAHLLAAALQVGLTGMLLKNEAREWIARLTAWILILCVAWVTLFAIAIYGPLGVQRLGPWLARTVTLAWLLHTASGVWSAFNSKSGQSGSTTLLDRLAMTAPPVFALGLFVLLSFGIYRATTVPPTSAGNASPSASVAVAWTTEASKGSLAVAESAKAQTSPSAAAYLASLKNGKLRTPWLGLIALAFVTFAVLLSLRVDVNEFSMHTFYRNRLVRCYLGASRPPDDTPPKDPRYACRRQPNPFTGFDPRDDLALKSLQVKDPAVPCASGYVGPYPILNASLNLVHGRRLAWQERKSESFTFTPIYCGGTVTGSPIEDNTAYRKTECYAYPPDGVYLGTALAVSGAAVSPLLGFHYSSAAGFLLTVFNARLGQWLANPKSDSEWNRCGPRLGFWWLLKELFGLMNDRAKYVNLTDGGHFENLGIYELVRRRVACIIVCDADADPELKFEDLGNAIRKCRSDFGAQIVIDLSAIRRDRTTLFSASSCARGTVTYTDGTQGDLIYLKASLTGREPSDVLAYREQHSQFPDQSTADQWFDESQFESYRQLGQFVAESALASTPGLTGLLYRRT
ncbi:MAG: patatin-like phospholipase family protein [Terriglobales bacterium]